MKLATPACAALLLVAFPGAGRAQFAPPSVTTPPAPTYGYQSYDPGNPTGFSHPNDMGYGTYHNATKLKGHRSQTLSYRHFRGY